MQDGTSRARRQPSLLRALGGQFEARELRRYLAVEALIFWGLIVLCWSLIPRANQFGIMTHSFSYLGGFDSCHNPRWWWVFSIAMTFWGAATVPTVFYMYRRFARVHVRSAGIGAAILLIGCVGIALVGLIPTGHSAVIGGFNWGRAHRAAGLTVAIAFGIGIFWHEILLFIDGFTRKTLGVHGYWRYVRPYTFWWVMAFLATYFLTAWVFVYERMKVEAAATGRHLEGSWTEALNTWYSIPFWETVMIVTLYIFLAWLPLVLPNEVPEHEDA